MTEANIAFVASLLADPSRAAMCLALAGGESRPAGELAARAGGSVRSIESAQAFAAELRAALEAKLR